MFHPSHYDNTRPDGHGALEVQDHTETTQDGRFVPLSPDRRFVPLKRTEVRGGIQGPLADLSLTQTFGYTSEQCAQALEAIYRFPLPGDAAVQGVRVRFSKVEIRAELKERSEAEEEYATARNEGRQAALVTRESPDVFTLHVTGIVPDQDVTVETAYVQLARAEGPGWSLRLPLTTAPRYVRADEAGSRHAHGQPLGLLRDPGHRFTLNLTLEEVAAVSSPTHALAVEQKGERTSVRLRDGEIVPDRDFVLTWQPAQEERRAALRVLTHQEARSGPVYFLAQLAPPRLLDPKTLVPREVILLVDHSGSMGGPKWEAADWAVQRFLSSLTANDRFALCLFHSTTRWFSPSPQAAEEATVAQAVRFLTENRDSGGTELSTALQQALKQTRADGDFARHVLILTDAQVSDEAGILALVNAEAKHANRRRISVLCIDSAPNTLLAQEMAERGGGTAHFLTSSSEEEDITTTLDAVLDDWAQPILSGLRLEVSAPGVQTCGASVLPASRPGWSAVDVGDLPAGRSVWTAGRVASAESRDLEFQVTNAQGRVAASCRVDVSGEAGRHPALKALFGARRLRVLENLYTAYPMEDQAGRLSLIPELERLGYRDLAAKITPTGNAEEDRASRIAFLRRLLVTESLDYGLACSETGFVAVRTEAGNPVEATVFVANALPSGWSDDFSMARMVAPAGAAGHYLTDAMQAAAVRSAGRCMKLSPRRALFSRASVAPVAGEIASEPAETSVAVFSGLPAFASGEAVLFDTTRSEEAAKLPASVVFNRLQVRFPKQLPSAESLPDDLWLSLYVDDLAAPRARVRLRDLMRQGGVRPLNLSRRVNQVVRIVLQDPSGAWSAPQPIEVTLTW